MAILETLFEIGNYVARHLPISLMRPFALPSAYQTLKEQ